ncbi:MAG: ABC transporter permease [Anaerolineae bacterium]|nr:ABC transporter permease [Anaerolineae bacterium]
MDFRKILTIALRDVRITFSDRSLLLIMIAAPLALTTIIGAAFSGFTGGSDVPIQNIQAAVVNEDEGVTLFFQQINFGDIITNIIVPPEGQTPEPDNTLWKLIAAQKMTREEAIAAVNDGKLAAAIIIPKDFSAALNPANDVPAETKITLYRDAGSELSAGIVTSVMRSIVNNVVSGNIAIFAAGQVQPTLKVLNAQAIAQSMAEQGNNPPITVNEITVDNAQTAQTFSPAQYFAPAMAVFFLTFTMAGSARSIIEEQNSWTLQRMVTTPTTFSSVLAGKLLGTYLTGVFQLLVLIVLMAIISPLFGTKIPVWGTNPVAVVLMALITTAAATGLGSILAAVARTAEQADVYGSALLTLMGLLGGAFFDLSNIPGLGIASRLTLNYWATNGFSTLARTNDLVSVLPNLLVLLIYFVVGFGIAVVLFNRRFKS